MPEYIERKAAIERLEKLMQLQAPTARAIIEAIPWRKAYNHFREVTKMMEEET